ncbi:PAS domain S-box protein [Natrononativus amylolyticus]|uniref:PAS domain S-box protein n=1 Tax=Natrononativus amylolyticus TaxID=2963434 RepID=UPI0020CDBAA1|nr:PAS domain-containing sensor histidine kinase [Natrononativus amylolyticus]
MSPTNEPPSEGERRRAFDSLAAASSDGIIMLDASSVIQYANPAVERILGYTPEELTNSSKMTIIPERLRHVHAEALQRYLETGEKHIDWTYVELPGLHKDGHEVPLGISLNDFEHEGDRYFVGTFRDISKRKAIERELERQNEQLDRFASLLAHELRNPLSVATASLATLDRESDETIEQVATALERMDEIIEVLLVLARDRDTVNGAEPVELAAAATAVWETVDADRRTLEVVSTCAIRVNPVHLEHVLENLFRNAITHNEGRVTVRVGALDDGFYVEDTGVGIDECDRPTVLEAGYTTRERGMGLGLAFVSQLAETYGWTLTLTESREGGARLEFSSVETVGG